MNREIKFRGKRVENGNWVYGDLVHNAFDGTSMTIPIGIQPDNSYPIAVHPETVGQYTGLKDKDGKEIYEGDVLKVNKAHDHYINRNYVVFYDDAAFQIETPEITGRCAIVKFIYDAFHKDEIEEFSDYTTLFTLIGNIHDNPELIK